jgi:5-methylthioadenosine/S-adenosylhomocysteine deaminase
VPAAARYSADWVFPITSPPIPHGALLVDAHGRIADVGADAHVPRPDGVERVDLGACALLPGLVNVHAHPELTVFRGLLEDLAFPDWIAALNTHRTRAQPADMWSVSARAACLEAIAAGITTVAATEDSAAAAGALRDAGLRGIVYKEVFGPSPALANDAFGALRAAVDDLRTEATDLVRIGVSPHAPYTVSDALFRLVADYARAEGLPVAVHAAESADEDAFVRSGAGVFADRHIARGIAVAPRARSTIELLENSGILELRPLLIHCVRVDAEDIARIAFHAAPVAHCPIANARLGHGIAPLGALLDAGVTVGLGTDSVASNNRMDLLEEARAAQLLQRASLRRSEPFPSARLLRIATLDGARALGLDGVIGSLVPGKEADLCALALDGPHVVPVHDPAAAVVHAARASDVVMTVVRGRVLWWRGQAHSMDASGVRRRLTELAAHVPTPGRA